MSPRGDLSGFVRIVDDRTLLIPERPGNRLADSLRNILENPAVALLFVIPGVGDTFRVNGRATLTTDATLLLPCAVEERTPRLGILVDIAEAFTHCAKVLLRADLWNPTGFVDRATLPTSGAIHKELAGGDFDADEYDSGPQRALRAARRVLLSGVTSGDDRPIDATARRGSTDGDNHEVVTMTRFFSLQSRPSPLRPLFALGLLASTLAGVGGCRPRPGSDGGDPGATASGAPSSAAAEATGVTRGPKGMVVDRPMYTLTFPAEWKLDDKDKDFDLDNYFQRIDTPGSCNMSFFLFTSKEDEKAHVAMQLAKMKEVLFKSESTETPFTTWGALTGTGVELKGRVKPLGPARLRTFMHADDKHSVLVNQFCFDEDSAGDAAGVRPGRVELPLSLTDARAVSRRPAKRAQGHEPFVFAGAPKPGGPHPAAIGEKLTGALNAGLPGASA